MKLDFDNLLKASRPYEYIVDNIGKEFMREDLLNALAANHSLLNAETMDDCVRGNVFSRQELVDIGIDPRFIDMLGSKPINVLPDVGSIDRIGNGTTEVYFWGIPQSGKTCALGSILAAARSATIVKSTKVLPCQGLLYQILLSQIFDLTQEYCILPGRTLVDANFAISTIIEDWERHKYPVTLIDMAGELFCAMLWKETGQTHQLTDNHERALAEFEKILVNQQSSNPKYHFFIIEYSEEVKQYKGIYQDFYLEHGLRYLEQHGVLRNANDGLFILVTKTDLMDANVPAGMSRDTYLINYLNRRYPNFLNLLRNYCQDLGICGGKSPEPIPFGIGEVCFQQYCKMNIEPAKWVIDMIINPPKAKKKWWR
jgi:hypothetical protein